MAKPVIPALGKREAQESAALLGYLLNLRTAWTIPRPCLRRAKMGGGRIEMRGDRTAVVARAFNLSA